MAKSMSLVSVEPLPLIATLATVLPTAKVVTSTSPAKVAVPPTSAKVKVVTPLMLPLAVISEFATLSPVESVNVFEPPVTTPSVKSPVVLLALVSIVVLLPKVTAPKLIASLELLIVDARVTVPVVLSVRPPLKVNESPDALPRFKLPVLSNVTALVKVPPPLKIKS